MSHCALHICDFAAPYPGAFIRQLQMLSATLQRNDWGRVAFVFPLEAAQREWLSGLRLMHQVHLVQRTGPLGDRATVAALRQVIHQEQPVITHCHFGGYDVATARATRHLRAGSRDRQPLLLWHYRTALEEPVADRSARRRAMDLIRYRIAGQGVHTSIAVTEALALEVAQRGLGSRSRAIVAGCDTETFVPDARVRKRVRAELGLGEDTIMLLHLGWAWHRKGGDLLADAARRLRAAGVDFRVFSVGAPQDEVVDPVKRIAPTSAIHELHQASDIFISASRSEGFGNGLVEAMACERVAVAAAASGQLEVFDGLHGVVTVAPGDVDALYDGIVRLVQLRDKWGQLGRENRKRVVDRHSMARWARELADYYAEIVP